MSLTERNENFLEEPFSLTVDQYGHLWLHAKIEVIPAMFDLGEKAVAFEIMAATMAENGYEYHPSLGHEAADNDDQK